MRTTLDLVGTRAAQGKMVLAKSLCGAHLEFTPPSLSLKLGIYPWNSRVSCSLLLLKMAVEREGLDYWTRWQVPVCALIVLAPAIAAVIVLSRSKDEGLRLSDLCSPCWRKLHPVWLLVYRALVVLIMTFFLFQMLLLDGANAFYFYTQ